MQKCLIFGLPFLCLIGTLAASTPATPQNTNPAVGTPPKELKINEEAVRKAAFSYAKEQIKDIGGNETVWDLNFDAKSIGSSIMNPEGGYLFRFFIDVDGDGRQELFLSCSYQSDRILDCWVYAQDANGNYGLIGKDFIIGDTFSWSTEPGKRELQQFFEADGKVGKNTTTTLRRYVITPGPKLEELPFLRFEPEEFTQKFGSDMAKFKQTYHIGEEITLSAEKITLADFLRDTTAKWRPYENGRKPCNQHFLNPSNPNFDEEWEAIDRSADFTFIKALEILGLEVPQYLREREKEEAVNRQNIKSAATHEAPPTNTK